MKTKIGFKPNVLLLYPKTGMDFGSTIAPPHALLTLAAPLLKAGFSVKLLDQRAHIITEQALKDHLSSDTICVGISTMTGTQIRYHYAGGGLLNVNPWACRIG